MRLIGKVVVRSILIATSLFFTFFDKMADAQTAKYEYDALGRLVSTCVQGRQSAKTSYTFDKAGNRERVNVSVGLGSVANGSFEQPSLGSGYAYNPAAPSLSFAGLSGIAGNGSAWGFLNAPEGTQVAFVRGDGGQNGSISLVAQELEIGRHYLVELSLAQRPNYGVNPLRITAAGSLLGTYVPVSTLFQNVSTASFAANAASVEIVIAGAVSNTDQATGVDSIKVVEECRAAAVVTNGSFEAPHANGFQYNPIAPGINFQGLAGIAQNGSAWGFQSAPEGNQIAFLRGDQGNGGSFSIEVTGLEAGRSYKVRFMIARRPNYGINPVSVTGGDQYWELSLPPITRFRRFLHLHLLPTHHQLW